MPRALHMILQRHRYAGRPQYIREEQFHVYNRFANIGSWRQAALDSQFWKNHEQSFVQFCLRKKNNQLTQTPLPYLGAHGESMGNPWGTHGEPMGNATSTKCAVATNDPDICIKRTPHSLGDAAHVT